MVVVRQGLRLRVLRKLYGSRVAGNLGCWRLMRGIMVRKLIPLSFRGGC